MTPVHQPNAYIRDWLIRVNTQYDEATPAKVKEADYDRAKESLRLGNITNNYFFSSARPTSSRGWFSSGDTNSHNRTYINNSTHIYNAPANSSSDSEDAKAASKKKKAKEEKTDWKGIAAIGLVSTAVAGISLFVYARRSKAAEGAVNYLESTKRIKIWSETNISSDPMVTQITQIAQTQLKIDQRAVDKITNYKYSILTSLVGTLAVAGGGIAILAAASTLATAGTTAVVAGGVLNSIAAMYAAYNYGMHWSDEKDGKEEFNKVKPLIPGLIANLNRQNPQHSSYASASSAYEEQQGGHWEATYSYSQGPSQSFAPYNPSREYQQSNPHHQEEAPPSYEESEAYQAICNQRRGIYPDLSGFAPSAPSYKH